MQSNLEYKIALGYGGVLGIVWFTIAGRQWIFRQRYTAAAERFFVEGNGDSGQQAMIIAGRRLTEVVIAALIGAVFAFAAGAIARRTWNSWDWATAAIGLTTVLSAILLCATDRIVFAAPFTLLPYWILLYRPNVRAACGVGSLDRDPEPADEGEEPVMIDLRRERENLVGLRQSLRVFELERGISTDTFVARYAQGLEDDSEDNEEWFALARMARRTEERLNSLNGHERETT